MSSDPRPLRALSAGALLLVLAVAGLAGCATAFRPFPLAEPMWDDGEDRRPFAGPPEEYFSPFAWDGADQMLFRPLARFFAVDPAGAAVDVNAMDEVPDSSWYENRLSRALLTPEQVVQAACDEPPLDPTGPWTVVDAKPNGANPGFVVKDAEGRRYLLKFDEDLQPERATSADVVGAIAYWAAGYHTACNRIVYFDRSILVLADDATSETRSGREVPLRWDMLDTIWERATPLADGRLRAMASRYLPGRPVGPFRYEDTRDDDPNDVVDHEDRRELRGNRVLAAWLNHFDSREQNTLGMWIEGEDGLGFVRHYFLDFGECFGSLWDEEGVSRRLGHASYLDMNYLLEDFVTLGAISRPWNDARLGPTGEILGYYDTERFVPDRWKPGYPNPAYLRAQEHDNAWMARILANFTEAHVDAAVAEARIHHPTVRVELARILKERRERILRRYLSRLSPLTWPEVQPGPSGRDRLCLRDLVVATGLHDWEDRPYWARAWALRGDALEPVALGAKARVRPDRVCVELPEVAPEEGRSHAYVVVDVGAMLGAADGQSPPARVHLYTDGVSDHRIVGLERPSSRRPP